MFFADFSLKATINAAKRVYKRNGNFRDQKMLNSAMAKVDDLLAMVSHLLPEQMIHKIRAAMEALVYEAEKG